jgi:hypothetical protein
VAAASALPPEPFYSHYWIGGAVSFEGVPRAGSEIELSRSGQKLTAVTRAGGRFDFNIFDLEYFQGVPAVFGGEYMLKAPVQAETKELVENVTTLQRQGYVEHSLTLARAGDKVPPRVVRFLPPSKPKTAPSTVVQIIFSKLMDRVSTEAAVRLSPSAPYFYDYEWENLADPGNPYSILRLIPLPSLNANTGYTVTVLNTARDIYGNLLDDEYTHNFWTVDSLREDDQPPSIISVFPPNGATGVATRPTLKLLFSEEMSRESVARALSLPDLGRPWLLTWKGSLLFLVPPRALTVSTPYTIGVSRVARDPAGNNLDRQYSFNFTTSAVASDTTPPEVISVSGGSDVDLSAYIGIVFSEPMEPATINDSNIMVTYVDKSTGLTKRLPGSIVWDTDSNTAYFRPGAAFDSFSGYTVIVRTGVMDLAGLEMLREYRTTFVTADSLGPEIRKVKFDGRGYVENDVIAADALISAEVYDPVGLNYDYLSLQIGRAQTADKSKLKAQDVYRDGRLIYQITPAIGDGTHLITIEAADARNNRGTWTGKVRVYSGEVILVPGTVAFAAPATISPLKSQAQGEEARATMVYNLTGRADIDLQLYGPTGVVWSRRYAAGTNGGLAGYNAVVWNGLDARSQPVSNGLYTFRVVRGGKSLGVGYIIVSD